VRKKLPFIALAAVPLLFWMLWFVLPESSIQAIIEDSAADAPFVLEVRGLGKGLFYTLTIEKLELRGREQKLGEFTGIRARINPLFLPLFQLRMEVRGSLSSGSVAGRLDFARDKTTGELEFKSVDFGELGLLRSMGIEGKGTVSGRVVLKEEGGHAEFYSNDAVFQQAEFSGVRVPLSIFHRVTGALDIHGSAVNIVSLALQGEDIQARLKGNIKDNLMNISMELMPGKTYLENPAVLAGLESFKISPGYYIIPLNNNYSLRR